MEIHPPEHGIHSWRDFLVHMGTITLGLLIAIALEQSVEWVHHREQRRQLLEDMRQEAAINAKRCEHYVKESMGPQAKLTDEWQQILWRAPVQNGVVTVTVPQALRARDNSLEEDTGQLPVLSVWTTAKQRGLVPLLPQKTVRFYDNLSYVLGLVESVDGPFWSAEADYKALVRSVTGQAPRIVLPQANVLTVTVDQRQKLLQDLAKLQDSEEYFVYLLGGMATLSHGIAEGVETGEQYQTWLSQHDDADGH